MNWNSLVRISHLKRFQQKQELSSATENAGEQLEQLMAEFDGAENVTKSLSQSAKKLLDQVLCVGKYEVTLSEGVASSGVFAEDSSMQTILEEWNSLAVVDNTIGDEYVISLQKTLVEPLKQLKKAFAELRAQIRLMEAVQLDMIKFQRKVSSYNSKDKTGQNLVKLQENKQALSASQAELAKQTEQLVNDLTKFNSGSLEMLKPLLEGFIAAELAWIQARKRTLNQRSRLVAATVAQTQSERLKSIEDNFKNLSALSICSSSK
uniref:Bridging integrator 3 n=1 Tax=Aceria tosichella TaxID=561515 RepID=A0A6G1SLT8_9ACAR